jgi:hypothetical protein
MMQNIYLYFMLTVSVLFPCCTYAAEELCDFADNSVTTLPVPQQSATAYRRAHQVADLATRIRDVDVVLLGDSITQLWPEALAEEAFAGKILNLGVGSDRTQNVLWRLRDERYAQLSPRAVFLMIGTNNLGSEDKPCAILNGLKQIIEHIDTLWHKPLLVAAGIIPRGQKSSFRDSDRAIVNRGLAAIVLKRGGAVIVDDTEVTLRCDKDYCPNFMPDMVHLAPQGYVTLGAAIRSALNTARKP